MSTRSKTITVAFLLVAATSLVDQNDNALALAQPCRSQDFAHNAYTVCEVDLAKHTQALLEAHRWNSLYISLESSPNSGARGG
jgi:hypothetical protein